jgi:hypothetical protein
MKRKFVKENKQLVREFIAGLISSIVAGKLSKNLEKSLMSKPETKKDIQDLRAIRKSIKTRLDKIKRNDPELYKKIQSRSF